MFFCSHLCVTVLIRRKAQQQSADAKSESTGSYENKQKER
jgi:hypothetical protein